jgi:hypothetical protein
MYTVKVTEIDEHTSHNLCEKLSMLSCRNSRTAIAGQRVRVSPLKHLFINRCVIRFTESPLGARQKLSGTEETTVNYHIEQLYRFLFDWLRFQHDMQMEGWHEPEFIKLFLGSWRSLESTMPEVQLDVSRIFDDFKMLPKRSMML